MSDTALSNQSPDISPPSGNPAQAEKYISQLIGLIEQDKLLVSRTDLANFDPSTLQDHYRLELADYRVEVSHSKHPSSGKDSYIILFTNIKNQDASCEKIILAYLHLEHNQFIRFKTVFDQQITRFRKAEEEKRLKAALEPIDQILEQLSHSEAVDPETSLAQDFN